MIHEEIVTYEVAKLAKEKGFPLQKVVKQDGRAFFYAKKPLLNFYDGLYYDSDMEDQYLSIDKHLFPEVTFENSPQQVEIKLIKDE